LHTIIEVVLFIAVFVFLLLMFTLPPTLVVGGLILLFVYLCKKK